MGHRKRVDNEFPNVLRALREDVYDWTKTEAAKRAEISISLYARYESGAVEPTLSNIMKLIKAFEVDFDTLTGTKKLRLLPSKDNSPQKP